MKIVLHLGLPKTATTFMQSELFPRLGPGVIYNPDDLFYFVNAIFKLGIRNESFVAEAAHLAREYERRDAARTLLLSSESFTQTAFDLNFEEHIELLCRIFPRAEVLVFLRNQPEWLASLYSEAVKNGYHQGIAEFLGYRDGRFDAPAAGRGPDGMRHANVWKCDWARLLARLRGAFGAGRVHVFFYEEFRAAPRAVAARMCTLIGCAPVDLDARPMLNRGLSAAAIALIVGYSRILARCGIRYPTWDDRCDRERARVLAQPFYWRKPARGIVQRLLRALAMEPWRLLRRVEPVSLVNRIDRRLPRRAGAAIEGEMHERLSRIVTTINAPLEAELGFAAVRSRYRPGATGTVPGGALPQLAGSRN